jgi:MscS family membrane protein
VPPRRLAVHLLLHRDVPRLPIAICLAAYFLSPAAFAAPQAPATDTLGRQTPRSSVTAFLEACGNRDYLTAAQYLDLGRLPQSERRRNGPNLAQKIEAILNSDPDFSVFRLSHDPQGDLGDDPDPNREVAATVTQKGQKIPIALERVALPNGGPQVWLFSQDTVAVIPAIQTSRVAPAIERYLPRVLVAPALLETALWKWLALLLLALLLISLSRLLDRLIALLVKALQSHFQQPWRFAWLDAVIQPLRVILWLAILRIGIGVVDPSAIARLYIGRGMQIVFVWSVAWCLIRLTSLLFAHIEARLSSHQQLASRTMLRLGRRTAAATITIFAVLFVLETWGYNTSTLIAGLGVGGIAIALAAQQTIANIFGGVSLIGDQPIRIGESGKFGDLVGVVEDIGMRSTRVRTLNRTLVSVPNSNFAGFNLENYSVRDKILFNPSFPIKRTTTDEQVRALLDALAQLLAGRRDIEAAATPARIVAISAASFTLEVFAYVRTPDMDAFYKIQSELLLQINSLFTASKIELA